MFNVHNDVYVLFPILKTILPDVFIIQLISIVVIPEFLILNISFILVKLVV